jgi:hypothetical protein
VDVDVLGDLGALAGLLDLLRGTGICWTQLASSLARRPI